MQRVIGFIFLNIILFFPGIIFAMVIDNIKIMDTTNILDIEFDNKIENRNNI